MPRPKKEADESTYQGRFAARLRSLRIAAKLDVDKLAEQITKAGHKVSAPTLYHWESGYTSPPMNALPFIARALKLKSVRKLLPDE